jgi:hypothetical protein
MPPLDQLDGYAKTDRLWLEGLLLELDAWNPEHGDKMPSMLRPKENIKGIWVEDSADSTKLRWRPAERDEKLGWIFLDGEKQRTPPTKPANERPKVRVLGRARDCRRDRPSHCRLSCHPTASRAASQVQANPAAPRELARANSS